MGYYVEIRPNDTARLSIAEFRQRFLDAGVELHPALTHPESSPEDRERYADDLIYSGGIISFCKSDKVTCGVTGDARMNWGARGEQAAELLRELLAIAQGVNATLCISTHSGEHYINEETLDVAVADYLKGSQTALGAFGSSAAPRKQGLSSL
jgi:sugar phosphate isomerase/epimerase